MDFVIKPRDDMTEGANQISTQSKDVAAPQDSIGALFYLHRLYGFSRITKAKVNITQSALSS
jgi:hypothetical protein